MAEPEPESVLTKEMNEVDGAIKELLQQKEGELNINNTNEGKKNLERKKTIDKTLKERLNSRKRLKQYKKI